jgi:hypothetical protein
MTPSSTDLGHHLSVTLMRDEGHGCKLRLNNFKLLTDQTMRYTQGCA